MVLRSVEDLVGYLEGGNNAKYVFFWGHTPSGSVVDQSCLSQWFESEFSVDSIVFPTAEHFMMHRKAVLFDDAEVADRILSAKTPGEAKALGREVRDFENEKWESSRWDIVVAANVAKFSQNAELRKYLLGTGERVLVEASPVDAIWGIGLDRNTALHTHPSDWRGMNLLGFALMEVRDRVRNSAV